METPDANSRRSAELVLDLPLANGRSLPVPVVRGFLDKRPVWFMIDTGAGSHVLAEWAVKEANLSSRSSDVEAIGQGGVSTGKSLRLVNLTSATIEGWGRLNSQTAIITELPDVLKQARVAGLINPQLIARSESVSIILDFQSRRIAPHLLSSEQVSVDGKKLLLEKTKMCSQEPAQIQNLLPLVRVNIGGRDLFLTVDTGGTTSTVYIV